MMGTPARTQMGGAHGRHQEHTWAQTACAHAAGGVKHVHV
jgi:hypothetical protein